MNMIAAISAAPAIGLPAGALAFTPIDRSVWDAALTRYHQARAEFDRLWDVYTAAEETCGAACPREDRYFDELNLGIGMTRERALTEIRYRLAADQGLTGLVLYPPEKRKECEAKLDAVGKEAERTADEFMAYQQRHFETKLAYRVEELNDVAVEYGEDHYFPAREALMRLPAPDEAGLLVKMEIATMSRDDDHAESALADARRLLAIH